MAASVCGCLTSAHHLQARRGSRYPPSQVAKDGAGHSGGRLPMREMPDGIEQYALISPSKVSLKTFGRLISESQSGDGRDPFWKQCCDCVGGSGSPIMPDDIEAVERKAVGKVDGVLRDR